MTRLIFCAVLYMSAFFAAGVFLFGHTNFFVAIGVLASMLIGPAVFFDSNSRSARSPSLVVCDDVDESCFEKPFNEESFNIDGTPMNGVIDINGKFEGCTF